MREVIEGRIFKSTYWWKSLVSAFLLLTLSHCADKPTTSPKSKNQIFPTVLEGQEHINPLVTDTIVSWEWIISMTNKQLSPKEQKRLRTEQTKKRRIDRIQEIKSNFSQLLENLKKEPVMLPGDTIVFADSE